MTKRPLFWLVLTAAVMLLLPWAAAAFVPPDEGMFTTRMILLAVGAGYSFAAGYYAGKRIHRLWWVPAECAGMLLLGTWIFFEMGDLQFLTYSGISFAAGMEAMLVSRLITGKERE